jgi:hypothetical protein
MEALFKNFDYGVVYPDGNQQVIARQENTAFLTKHLRMYGGRGEYEGHRIGRVLRDITFSGKALVKNPANPGSIIFNDNDMFNGVLANTEETKVFLVGASDMSEEIIRDLKDQNAALEQKLTHALKKLEEMGEAAVQAKLDAKDGTIVDLKQQVETHAKTIEELKTSVSELEKSRDDAVASKIEAEEKLTKAEEKIQATEAEALKTSRISVLVDKGVDKAKAEEVVAKFDALDEEKFNEIVDMQAEIAKAKCGGDKDKDKDKKDDKSDKSDADADTEEETSEEETSEGETEETLDTAEEDKDAAMASEETSEEDNKLQEAIAGYLCGYLGSRDKKQD